MDLKSRVEIGLRGTASSKVSSCGIAGIVQEAFTFGPSMTSNTGETMRNTADSTRTSFEFSSLPRRMTRSPLGEISVTAPIPVLDSINKLVKCQSS